MTSERERYLRPLRLLVTRAGARFFFARRAKASDGTWDPDGGSGLKEGRGLGYWLPSNWQHTPAHPASALDDWDGESAICLLTGFGVDVVDHDPRNGSVETAEACSGRYPEVYATVSSASPGGEHFLIAPLGLHKAKRGGIDILGKSQFAFAPGTRRRGKDGQLRTYEFMQEPTKKGLGRRGRDKTSGDYFRDYFGGHQDKLPAPALTAAKPTRYEDQPEGDRREIDRRIDKVILRPELARLQALKDAAISNFAANKTPYRGEPWRESTRDVARTLVKAARAPWNQLSLSEAKRAFMDAAPTDPLWTRANNETEWNENVAYAEANDEARALPTDLPSAYTLPAVSDPERPAAPAESPEVEEARATLSPEAFELFKRDLIADEVKKFKEAQAYKASGQCFADSNLNVTEILNYPEPECLIEGIIDQDSVGFLYSASGLGKTTFMVNMMLCVATGTKFLGRPVKKGRVLYIAGEGQALIGQLVRAWKAAHPWAHLADEDFTLHKVALMLEGKAPVADATAHITENEYVAVVVDTLNNSAGTLGENDSTGMSLLMAAGRTLIAGVPSSTLVFVHHSGYDREHMRGSTALYASADFVLKMSGNKGEPFRVEFDKRKFGESVEIGQFILHAEHGSVGVKGFSSSGTRTIDGTERDIALARLLFATFGAAPTTHADYIKIALAGDKENGVDPLSKTTAERCITRLRDDHKILAPQNDKAPYRYVATNPDQPIILPEVPDDPKENHYE